MKRLFYSSYTSALVPEARMTNLQFARATFQLVNIFIVNVRGQVRTALGPNSTKHNGPRRPLSREHLPQNASIPHQDSQQTCGDGKDEDVLVDVDPRRPRTAKPVQNGLENRLGHGLQKQLKPRAAVMIPLKKNDAVLGCQVDPKLGSNRQHVQPNHCQNPKRPHKKRNQKLPAIDVRLRRVCRIRYRRGLTYPLRPQATWQGMARAQPSL